MTVVQEVGVGTPGPAPPPPGPPKENGCVGTHYHKGYGIIVSTTSGPRRPLSAGAEPRDCIVEACVPSHSHFHSICSSFRECLELVDIIIILHLKMKTLAVPGALPGLISLVPKRMEAIPNTTTLPSDIQETLSHCID
jgi:hypothetical protein